VIEPSARLAFLVEYLDLPEATGDPAAQWEVFQLQYLNNPSLLTIDKKGRQVGWSWIAAAGQVAASILEPRKTSLFVSLSQDEATEKVRYARHIMEALDAEVRPKLIIDNRLELEIENGSRLISHPCRPIRGKAKADVILDEFAHYPKEREIYTSALPVASRGGQIRIGSSPLGAGGLFWEIYDQKIRTYPGYRRQLIPWWLVRGLCRDVADARTLAPHMTTEERVRLFGSARLIELFENLPLSDFQQEYECSWVDESVAWITWDDIKRNQELAQAGQLVYWQAHDVEAALRIIAEVAQAIKEGRLEGALAGGLDVGRHHDLTELTFVGKTTTAALPYRLGISLSQVKFEDQKQVVLKALDVLPVTNLLMDRNGLGMQLAEDITSVHGARAQGVDFTNETKELWAVELKVQMQRGNVPLPLSRDLGYQIHSIKKKTTAAKNATFDTAANERHHADKFWSLALAIWAASPRASPAMAILEHYRRRAEEIKHPKNKEEEHG
jgi:phage FluMu gp28-like protein